MIGTIEIEEKKTTAGGSCARVRASREAARPWRPSVGFVGASLDGATVVRVGPDEPRRGMDDKDRATMLPASVKTELAEHLERMRAQHERDLAKGAGWVELPGALAKKPPPLAASGPGSGSSPPRAPTSTPAPATSAATTSTRPPCSAP